MTDADKATEKKLSAIVDRYTGIASTRENVRACLLEIMDAFIGIKETGTTNSGYWIDKFHTSVGLRPGYPWCLMLLQFAYKYTSDIFGMKDLLPNNTAGTQQFAKWAEENKLTLSAIIGICPGDILVWRNGTSAQGHVGMVSRVSPNKGQVIPIITIEGNTSSRDYRDGGTVAMKAYEYSQAELGTKRKGRYLRCIVSFDALFNEAVK